CNHTSYKLCLFTCVKWYSVRDIAIAFNNHYAGFGPQSVNDFLKLMGENQIDWKDDLEKMSQQNGSTLSTLDYTQRSMSDFTT
ncbi:MAG: hypothetical protein L0H55_15930, partial [Candidatus Nitrosocosmicus sp.]|nr:hypothetical protein [Candidatus Nitrosocosmicus sp.]